MRKSELKFLKQSMMYVPDYGRVVEIGSWTGGSSEQLAQGIKKYCPTSTLYCIDPFDEEYFKKRTGLINKMKKSGVTDVLEYFKKRMKPYKYELVRKTSEQAFEYLFDFDEYVHFIFIDGNHDYEVVKQDIDLWWTRLETGGVMCGHDYGKWGVKKAVDETVKFYNYLSAVRFPAESMWMITK